MIKFLHAADLHLDAPFSALSPEQAAARRQEQRALRRLGGLCGALALGLGTALSRFTGGTAGAVQGFSGATLLSESAGGYVLVGVAAFTAASALTLLCMCVHEKEKRDKEKNKESYRGIHT